MLKLLSYNVLEGALPDRLPAVLRVIASADADIVAIQEARHWRRNRREAFRRVARDLGMRGVLAKANSGFDIAIFSRLPILGRANHGLDTIFLHTTVSVDLAAPGGETFTLFVTHLRPDYPSRRREMRLLLEWMRPYRRSHCALCGDLNSLMAGDPIDSARIWRESELERGPQGVIAAIEARRRVARVDYIFASRPLARALTACRVLRHPELLAASDHSPVWAEFDI